jgi:uncharacterized protein YjiS (DUF1127 family)
MPSSQITQATRPAPPVNYPVVESLIDLFARWLQHRREIAGLCSCDAAEFSRIASDLGVSPNELDQLIRRGPHVAEELPKMMAALGLDGKTIARAQPLVMRDLERVCALCEQKKQCDRDLAAGTAAQHYEEYCVNASTFASLGAGSPSALRSGDQT